MAASAVTGSHNNSQTTNNTSWNIDTTTVLTDDYMIVQVGYRGAQTLTPPAGWTQVISQTNVATWSQWVGWKKATSNNPTETFGLSGSGPLPYQLTIVRDGSNPTTGSDLTHSLSSCPTAAVAAASGDLAVEGCMWWHASSSPGASGFTNIPTGRTVIWNETVPVNWVYLLHCSTKKTFSSAGNTSGGTFQGGGLTPSGSGQWAMVFAASAGNTPRVVGSVTGGVVAGGYYG